MGVPEGDGACEARAQLRLLVHLHLLILKLLLGWCRSREAVAQERPGGCALVVRRASLQQRSARPPHWQHLHRRAQQLPRLWLLCYLCMGREGRLLLHQGGTRFDHHPVPTLCSHLVVQADARLPPEVRAVQFQQRGRYYLLGPYIAGGDLQNFNLGDERRKGQLHVLSTDKRVGLLT